MPAIIKKNDHKAVRTMEQKPDDCFLITSAAVQTTLKPEHFDPAYLKQLTTTAHRNNGRATVWFFNITESDRAVLRHYHRGGMVAKVVNDQFIWTGINRTRAVSEYRLLEWMHTQGLPVPEPLGARVQRHGMFYTCDLITRLYPDSRTMAQTLSSATLDDNIWHDTGYTIAKIHQHNIWHSDLNANNILINDQGQIKLIDFDRCRRRTGERWKQKNLERLERSLNKLTRLNQIQYFDKSKWQLLLDGYREGVAANQL